ncbi:MFS transporter [Mycolicibacterium peregrinum]|uniref:MFS transporter n=1 Tax=Mycolicibacterium peregrinum TaxID=43304 RepID=A0A1A0W1A3_MYCPR|nr:MFS transporter [Mycolicibacterium peregrinum]OBB89355.1 MFS transporter [Mycolicibacterium peregrinum]
MPAPLCAREVPVRAGVREWAALAVLMLATVLLAIDGTVLYLAVPALAADITPTATQMLWIGDVYSFALAGLLVTMGNLADRIGRKRLLLIGSIGFGLASALAAFSTTPEMLITARVLLGVTGATIMPSTLSIARNLFADPVQRTTALAAWTAGATGGAALGPLVGGFLLERYWWGSVFLINVPLMVVVVLAGIALLPESKNPDGGRLDLVSATLSIAAIVPTVFAVKHVVGTGFDWTVAASVFLGTGGAWAFLRRQRALTQPLIDLSLFRLPAFSGAVAADTIAIFAFIGVMFFFSQHLQLVLGMSPFQAGLAELPASIATVAVVGIVGHLLTRLGRGRAIAGGLAISALGLVSLAITEGWSTYWGIGVSLGIIGLGVGAAMTLSTDAVVSAAPAERAGAAASISETAYELGVALGIAVLGTLHTVFYRTRLPVPEHLSATDRVALHDSLATATNHFANAPHLLAQAQHAFTFGVQVVSLIAAVLLAAAAAVALKVIPSTPVQRGQPTRAHRGLDGPRPGRRRGRT